MNKPKNKRKFGRKWYTYSGFTWSTKGKEKRKKFWNRLGYSVRFISSGGYRVKPLPKSKYLVYTRKKAKAFHVTVKFKTNKDGTVTILSSKRRKRKQNLPKKGKPWHTSTYLGHPYD